MKRPKVEILSWVSLGVGVMILLNEAASSGEALETFRLVFSSNAGTLAGARIVLLAAASLVALHTSDFRRILKHR